ncbi:hypothetical protein AXG93_620s1230 [Marchantia polymorpha subsp. ruderalis]|nr:hypothetical protein AXG93_620s1230 [Marchantia polymorpha subsp. ruderalis]
MMADSQSRQVVVSAQLLLLLLLGSCMVHEIEAVEYASQRVNDLETVVPPYLDSFGAPSAQVKVYYRTNSTVGKLKLGKLYDRNQTQAAPHVVIKGDAVQKNDFYTLLTVDPDARSPTNFTARNILHWMVTNIPGNIKSSQAITDVGDVIQPYAGPAPPIGTHRYIFLLFSQGYKKIEVPAPTSRALFSVRNFTTTYQLGWPLGGTLFRASFDDQ